MTFVSLGFLAAALAAGIPVALHMINRQKARDLPFSTLRFLRISVEKTRRRRRIHDILLLLLRMALLILIALGLAELTITDLSNFWGSGSTAVAIVLDNSASMGVEDRGRPRFETARAAAMEIMEQLDDGDQVVLMLTGGAELITQDKLHKTHDEIYQTLDQVQVSYEAADLARKIEDARKLLTDSKAENKQIYVLTDMQRLCWEGLAEQTAANRPQAADEKEAAEREEALEIPVILVDCDREPKPNVAITDVELRATIPVAGMPISASVQLFNAAASDESRHVELYLDGAKADMYVGGTWAKSSIPLDVPAGRQMKYDFQFKFERGGLHRGEVRLVGDDGSSLDDRRYFTMEVNQGIPVAIVKSQQHEIPYLDDTYYLEQALNPARGASWAISVTTLTAEDLRSEPLSNYTAIYCVNLPAPDADAATRLARYAADGGHLVWICGDNVDVDAYNQMNRSVEGKLLPAPLLDVRVPESGSQRDSWNISHLDPEHPALTSLVEPASLYQSVLVYKHVRVDADSAPGARVMGRLDDGEAILLERPVDEGSVMMLGTSVHVGWTNLPVRPLFLPLWAQITFELAGAEQARRQGLAGRPLIVPLEDQIRPSAVEIHPPSGTTIRLNTTTEGAEPARQFVYDDTHEVGIYTLRLLEGARPVQLAYAVNVDPDEAASTKIAPEELEKRFGRTPVLFAEDPDDLSSTFAQLREGVNLWWVFLSIVLVVLVFETLLSNVLSPKKDDDETRNVAPGMRRLARRGRGVA